MICYKAADNRETPNLMTRFREEVYATSWYKAALQRANHESHPETTTEAPQRAAEQRALRSEYFKKKQKAASKYYSAQKRLLDAR